MHHSFLKVTRPTSALLLTGLHLHLYFGEIDQMRQRTQLL
ncbi:hypothetical protein BAE44_0000118 [Dichanthelium oligosanthes]|uniref:Uncharacterized protein n=1 Tax=Dichanthelium oligosanthes TaxID=888268 RepID=A0A1E5WNB6_9POAL|nr:hypothetical protein BAE44_0000118 [Dichanthelium oligosanthes]